MFDDRTCFQILLQLLPLLESALKTKLTRLQMASKKTMCFENDDAFVLVRIYEKNCKSQEVDRMTINVEIKG